MDIRAKVKPLQHTVERKGMDKATGHRHAVRRADAEHCRVLQKLAIQDR